jgi:FkbM family methyltransferase
MSVRTLLERISRGRLVRRRLPHRVGGEEIWLSPESALRYWTTNLDHPAHSRWLFDMAERYVRPGGVVWDVGANCGIFSVASAALAGPSGAVLSIEPDHFTAQLIRRTSRSLSQRCARIDVVDCAVSDKIGIATLNIAKRGRSTNFLDLVKGRTDTGGVRETELAITVTLDWIADMCSAPSVIKIDVEGCESFVVRGARQVLANARPVVICEVGDDTRAEVGAVLLDIGYDLFDAELPIGSSCEGWQSCANLLAIPADRGYGAKS